MLRPRITMASDPILVGEALAALIRSDRRNGLAQALDPSVRFQEEDPERDGDNWTSPAEINASGVGDCAKLVRVMGNEWGTHVGVIRVPGGYHVFLVNVTIGSKPGSERFRDPCVERGMPKPPQEIYKGGVRVMIWPPGTSPKDGPGGGAASKLVEYGSGGEPSKPPASAGPGPVGPGEDPFTKLLQWSAAHAPGGPVTTAVHEAAKTAAAAASTALEASKPPLQAFRDDARATLANGTAEQKKAAAALLAVTESTKGTLDKILAALKGNELQAADRDRILEAIAAVKASIPAAHLPPIYVNVDRGGYPAPELVDDSAEEGEIVDTGEETDDGGHIVIVYDAPPPAYEPVAGWRPSVRCPGTVACKVNR